MGILSERTGGLTEELTGELKEFMHLHALCMDIWCGSARVQERYDFYLMECSDTQRTAECFFKEAIEFVNPHNRNYNLDITDHWIEQMLDKMRHLVYSSPVPEKPCAYRDPFTGKRHSWTPCTCSRCNQFVCECESWFTAECTGKFAIE